MPRVETVEIFKSRETGLYKLQRKCPHPSLKGPTSIGEPEILSEQELSTAGVPIILDALASSLQRCSDPTQIKTWDRAAYQEFRRNHEMVSISRWEDSNGRIEVEPMVASEGGYRNLRGTRIRVQLRDVETGLIPAILAAFKALSGQQT